MRLQDEIPYMVCVNLAEREDRRRDCWTRFSEAGLVVDRQPGILKKWVTDSRGFIGASRYGCSLAKRLAVRRAKLAGAPAMLLFEDDVILADDLHERLAKIELPADWGIFFLGCKHLERPLPLSEGLVKVARAADHHAMAIRADYYNEVIRGLSGHGKGAERTIRYSDAKMAEIQSWVPTYAAFPNLAWQALSYSDNAGTSQSHYNAEGKQLLNYQEMKQLEIKMQRFQKGDISEASKEGTSSMDELSRIEAKLTDTPVLDEDARLQKISVHHSKSNAEPTTNLDEPPGFSYLESQPQIQSLDDLAQLRYYINLGRREDRRVEVEYQFALQGLPVMRFAAVNGRTVRNTRGHGRANQYACRLGHRMILRHAKINKAPAVMIFEDDVALNPDFRRLAEALQPPDDWGLLFFGCTHVEPPEVVSPSWVKIKRIWSLQAYVVRESYYDTLLKALNAHGREGEEQGADVIISNLSSEIPMYAVYPNLAWQEEGYSDLMGIERKTFRNDGHQNRLLHVLREANRKMKDIIALKFGDEALYGKPHALLRPWEIHHDAVDNEPRWTFDAIFGMIRLLNLDRREDRRLVAMQRLENAGLSVERFSAIEATRVPRGSELPKGAYGCALSHRLILREGRKLGMKSVLIFEDDVALHPRLREWAELIPLPVDWGILYLGCQHVSPPIPVARGLVRATGAYSTHAFAVKAPYFRQISKAIRNGCKAGIPCDVVLASLHQTIPTYAFYPNLAWQESGQSDIKMARTLNYGKDGVQRWHRVSLEEADRSMRILMHESKPMPGVHHPSVQ